MNTTHYDRSLFIFRRDLRVQDNTSLIKCYKKSKKILACFIFDPVQVTHNKFKSNNAIQFMIESLKDLKFQLNGKLNIYYGNTSDVVTKLLNQYHFNAVWCNTDYTPFSKMRDENLRKITTKFGAVFKSYEDILLNPILKNPVTKKGTNDFYLKFTPFYLESKKRKVQRPQRINTSLVSQKCVFDKKGQFNYKHLNKMNPHIAVKGGRQEAKKILLQLQSNTSKFKGYATHRNRLTFKTSLLSAHNKFGTISVREFYHAIKNSKGLNKTDKESLSRQLYWRDFYTYVIWSHPNALAGPIHEIQTKYSKIPWLSLKTKKGLQYWTAWTSGKTGYPIVDACMHQLNKTGYMHNRGRLIVSNFLIRHLGINWRHGEKYFATKLVDYDPIQNNQGWQFSASSGASAQDWFRVMNPWTQQKKFDPDSKYIKQWLPAFNSIPEWVIYDWDTKWKDYLKNVKGYPPPIVDHDTERKRTLKIFSLK
jgi:deoxyribodipyrimidine photo-lyase